MPDSGFILPPTGRVIDASMAAVNGGSITFYAAGTSTPLTVYSDSTLSTSLGSVVYLDSGGHPVSTQGGSTKVIIYTGDALVKMVVKDSTGTTIATYDNVKVTEDLAGAGGGGTGTGIVGVVSKTADYTVLTTDDGKWIDCDPTGGAFTITLPSAVTAGDGFHIGIRHAGTTTANTVKLTTVSSQSISINGVSMTALALTGGGEALWLVSTGAGWRAVSHVPPRIVGNVSVFRVADRLTAPPASPNPGARYIINGTPGGAWSAFAQHDVMEADGQGNWIRHTPPSDCGWLAYVDDENLYTGFIGSAWTDLANATAPSSSTIKRAVFSHQENAGANGGTSATTTWTAATLNTDEVNTITGCSRTSSAITLPAGTYMVRGTSSHYQPSTGISAQLRLRGTSVSLYGPRTLDASTGSQIQAGIAGVVTLSGEDTLNFEYYVTVGAINTGLGNPIGLSGIAEIYRRLEIIDLTAQQGPQGAQGVQGIPGTGYGATSTTSLAIGTGSKTFTTQSGLAYSAGARVRASSAADPTTHYMEGVCVSYSGTTLALSIENTGGSGTRDDWNINASGEEGATYVAGSLSGNTGLVDNALLRADGTGGSAIQASPASLDDSGNFTVANPDVTGTGQRYAHRVQSRDSSNVLVQIGGFDVAVTDNTAGSVDAYSREIGKVAGVDVFTRNHAPMTRYRMLGRHTAPSGSDYADEQMTLDQVLDWTFTQGGTGGATRALRTKVSEWISATDYGMDTAGTAAANATAMTNAIAAASSGGKVVWVPGGTYNCNAFTVTAGVVLFAPGVTFTAGSSQTNLITVGGSNVIIEGPTINCGGNVSNAGILLDTSSGAKEVVTIRNVRINNPVKGISDAASSGTIEELVLEHVTINFPTGAGVRLEDATQGFIFAHQCHIDFNGTSTDAPGFYFENCDGLQMSECHVLGSYTDATYAAKTNQVGFYLKDIVTLWATDCYADTMGSYGWLCDYVEKIETHGCGASQCGKAGVYIIDVDGTPNRQVLWDGYVKGRSGITTPPANVDGFVLDTCVRGRLNLTIEKCTGSGLLMNDSTNILGSVSSGGNTGHGIKTTGTGSCVLTVMLDNNTAGQFSLSSASDILIGNSSTSGAGMLVANNTKIVEWSSDGVVVPISTYTWGYRSGSNGCGWASDGSGNFVLATGAPVANRWWVSYADGHFSPYVTDTYDIGSATYRPRDVFAGTLNFKSYTVAGLPAVGAGKVAYASNGRKNGEGPGAGTGVLVFSDATAWRACDTGATVAA